MSPSDQVGTILLRELDAIGLHGTLSFFSTRRNSLQLGVHKDGWHMVFVLDDFEIEAAGGSYARYAADVLRRCRDSYVAWHPGRKSWNP